MIFFATLTFVSAKEEPLLPPELAELDAIEADFLERHVSALRGFADKAEGPRSKFQRGSNTKDLFATMLTTDAEGFVEGAGVIVERLVTQMRGSTTPKPGILAIVSSGENEAIHLSVLKLEAIHEAAEFERRSRGRIKLKVLKELLPAPGGLKKGISWPDPRRASDAIVQDTNITSAQYFFNACQLDVSPKATETEKELFDALVSQVPKNQLRAAVAAAARHSGPADRVIREIREELPELQADRRALGVGGLAGPIREGQLLGRKVRLSADGIDITVPTDRLDRVSDPVQEGGQWIVTIRFDSRPTLRS